MKAVRYIAACLLLISGVLHLYGVIKNPSDPLFAAALTFGIIYLVLGVLLIINLKFAIWLGLIIPIIPLILSTFMADWKTLDAMSFILLAIDLIVAVCCFILLLKKKS